MGFGARRALTHPVAGGTDDPELSSETFFFPLPRDVGSQISARVDLVPAHLCKPETGPEA